MKVANFHSTLNHPQPAGLNHLSRDAIPGSGAAHSKFKESVRLGSRVKYSYQYSKTAYDPEQ